MARNVAVVFMVLLFASLSMAITLTPVWEITRPEEWAEIRVFRIHLDDFGNPLVVCQTDSGFFRVDYAGVVSTLGTFSETENTSERGVMSSTGRYLAIMKHRRLTGGATNGDIRVIKSDGTVIWEETSTLYSEIDLADEGPWSIATIPEITESGLGFHDFVIRNPAGSIVYTQTVPELFHFTVSPDGSVFSYAPGDTAYLINSSGVLQSTIPVLPPGLEDYRHERGCATPSFGFLADYLIRAYPRSGKVVFGDSTGAFGSPIDVQAEWHGDIDISADGNYAVLGTGHKLYFLDKESASVLWSATDPDGPRAHAYRSVEITDDCSLVIGCVSPRESPTSRLEIYDQAGTELLNESYPTIGVIKAQMLPDGSYLAVRQSLLTSLGRDVTLILYQIIP